MTTPKRKKIKVVKKSTSKTKKNVKPIASTKEVSLDDARTEALLSPKKKKSRKTALDLLETVLTTPKDDPPSIPRKPRKNAANHFRNEAVQRQIKEEKRLQTKETIRDISRIPPGSNQKEIDFSAINWERRLACKADPILDLRTYYPNIFYQPFGAGHEKIILEADEIIQDGGKKIITCPRRFGKSAICRGMILRAMKYGMRQFPFFVGSKEPKAIQTLGAVKGLWHRSPELYQDFPEFAYGIYRIGGRGGPGCQGQEWKGTRTYIEWSADELQLPTLLLDKDDVKPYLDNDPDCVVYLPDRNIDIDRYIIKGSGCICRVAGIDGSIRGEADLHPILLTQPRPDLILLDDIVRDQKADSPTSSEKLESLVESVIDFLAAPGVSQGILWPGTVIREGDPTDNYSDRMKHPEWGADRISLIVKYPEGFTDDIIPQEFDESKSDTQQKAPDKKLPKQAVHQGRLWLEYRDVLEKSLYQHATFKLANEFYLKNQVALESGFEVAWDHMHVQESKNPDKNEISTIQHAMNKRFQNHPSFLSEIQNRPKSLIDQGSVIVSAKYIRQKQTGIPRDELSVQWNTLVGLIDTQGEILFYTLFACDKDFNGQFIAHGTFPKIRTNYFRKSQTYGWKLLSKLYARDNPEQILNPSKSGLEAPLEARIYNGLKQCCDELLNKKFLIQHSNMPMQVQALGIDTKWGQSSETVKRFVREYNNRRVMIYEGQAFGPGFKQLEEYEPRAGWLFEHQLHPHVKESKWCIKPYEKSQWNQTYIQCDVNRQKSFLMKRLATPLGSTQGCITLFNAPEEEHKMFAEHIADSQYPESKQGRGMTKDMWLPKPGGINDDDFLDTATGCLTIASICGVSLKTQDHVEIPKETGRVSLRDMYKAKANK